MRANCSWIDFAVWVTLLVPCVMGMIVSNLINAGIGVIDEIDKNNLT